MSDRAHDWRSEIVRLIQVKQRIHESSPDPLWEFHLPGIATNSSSLDELERELGFRMNPLYREFLTYGDGWPSFFQSVDLFSTADLRGSWKSVHAMDMLNAIDPAVLELSGLRAGQMIPIAATAVDLDIFVTEVRGGVQQSEVIWLAGSEVDRFATFEEYFLAMIEYNERELAT